MIEPIRAPVRPRVFAPAVGSLLLDDEIRARLDAHQNGLVELLGSPGSGKSTALAHLAHRFRGETGLLLADDPDEIEQLFLLNASRGRLIVATLSAAGSGRVEAQAWRLAGWTRDECIEYLLAVHPSRCNSVMERIQSAADRHWTGGNAELWRIALDRLAADDSLEDVRAALLQELDEKLNTPPARLAARVHAFHCMSPRPQSADVSCHENRVIDAPVVIPAPLLLRHTPVQLLLAAEYLAEQVNSADVFQLLRQPLPEELVSETGSILHGNAHAVARLRRMLTETDPEQQLHADTTETEIGELLSSDDAAHQPMATSLLHAMGAEWPAEWFHPTQLTGAYLAGLRWPGVTLTPLDVTRADLTGADLSGAQLYGFTANGAQLSGARFQHARLDRLSAKEATLVGADFSSVLAFGADLSEADLRGANFDGAIFIGARLVGADLSGASFRGSDLTRAELTYARLDGTDFTDAKLSRANLDGLSLQSANFTGAHFGWAHLQNCDLEGVAAENVNFRGAFLKGAHLTGSRLPGGTFRWADLRKCGLADVEWERADLRGADLRGSSFHLGSSRSGLVGSPIACEGSRTGFYTDEYHEQDFKSPEEIRKANLRGADLRGAKIENVDFYLVDLRGALYTPEQELQLRGCKAILETRACGR